MPPKKQAKPLKFSKKNLLAALHQSGAPLRSKNIYDMFGADASLKKVIKATLAQMVESGDIVQMGKSYGLLDNLQRMTGTLDVRRSGVGYLIADDRKQKDLFIHPSNFGGPGLGTRSSPWSTHHAKKTPRKDALWKFWTVPHVNCWSGSAGASSKTAISATPRTRACPSTP